VAVTCAVARLGARQERAGAGGGHLHAAARRIPARNLLLLARGAAQDRPCPRAAR